MRWFLQLYKCYARGDTSVLRLQAGGVQDDLKACVVPRHSATVAAVAEAPHTKGGLHKRLKGPRDARRFAATQAQRRRRVSDPTQTARRPDAETHTQLDTRSYEFDFAI